MRNVAGVTIFVIVFYGLCLFIDRKFLSETASAWNIAVIHTCFNVAAEMLQISEGKLDGASLCRTVHCINLW